MQIALARDWAPRTADRGGAWARLWGAVRGFFFEGGGIARHGRASLARPRALPAAPPPGEQARDLKYSSYAGHPGYGVTPQRVVDIFRLAELGQLAMQCDLFDDLIERDGTLRNLFEQRELAVAGKPRTIQAGGPGDTEELAARILGAAHEDLPTIETLQHQLQANRHGFSATEVDWGVRRIDGRDWVVPIWLANVPHRRFAVDVRTDELLLTSEASPLGEPLRDARWWLTRRPGQIARAGLMRTAIWPALWKSFSVRDWIVYSEMFGVPLVHATYRDLDTGDGATDDNARATAEEIVRRIGSSGGAVTPESIKVDIKETRGADNAGTHGALVALANAELSKLINGATLANDNAGSGGASYALGAVHASTRYDLVVADAARLAESWRRAIAVPFMRFNQLDGAAPRLGLQIVPELDPFKRLQCADIALNKLGIALSKSQFRNEIGLREPLGPDDEAAGAPKAPAASAQGGV